jgi:hypothetical protein
MVYPRHLDAEFEAFDKVDESMKRIHHSGVDIGDTIIIGGNHAEEQHYLQFVSIKAVIYTITTYDAKAMVVTPEGKMIIIDIDDCILHHE